MWQLCGSLLEPPARTGKKTRPVLGQKLGKSASPKDLPGGIPYIHRA